jgi:signal transduction histidine kinase
MRRGQTLLDKLLARTKADPEFAQGLVRLVLGSFVLLYGVGLGARADYPLSHTITKHAVTIILFAYLVVLTLTVWIWRIPGRFWQRRLILFTHDYFWPGILLLMAGQEALPLYAAIVSITVGNALRFGQNEFWVSLGFALVTTILVWLFNPYWMANPYIGATLLAVVLIIPIYVYSLSAQLRRANIALSQASLDKSRFLTQASHDLRHPLQALRLIVRKLRATDLNGAQDELVTSVDLSAQNAVEMLQSLLDISIIETGRLEPRNKAIDLGNMLLELAQVYTARADQAGVQLRFVKSTKWVIGDQAILKTILQNLISNSITHSRGAKICLGVRRRADQLWLDIYDRGSGQKDHTLEAMQSGLIVSQLDTLVPASTGIGLAMSDRLAKIAGLDLVLRLDPIRGSCAMIGPFAPLKGTATEQTIAAQASRLTGLAIVCIGLSDRDVEIVSRCAALWHCDLTITTDANIACDAKRTIAIVDGAGEVAKIMRFAGVIRLGDLPADPRFDQQLSLPVPIVPRVLRSKLLTLAIRMS